MVGFAIDLHQNQLPIEAQFSFQVTSPREIQFENRGNALWWLEYTQVIEIKGIYCWIVESGRARTTAAMMGFRGNIRIWAGISWPLPFAEPCSCPMRITREH
jgi:hypothetical protein